MRPILAALAGYALPFGGVALAEAPLGVWQNEAGTGLIQIYRCEAALCGRIIGGKTLTKTPDQRDVNNSEPALRNRPVQGLVVLEGFTGGPERWTGGPLYDPETGDGAARGRIERLGPETLKVTGCRARIFCRSQVWTRADRQQYAVDELPRNAPAEARPVQEE